MPADDPFSRLDSELALAQHRIAELEGEREILGRRTLKLEAELAAEKRAVDALEAENVTLGQRCLALDAELARVRTLEQSGSLAAIRDAEEMAERERKRADALAEQNSDLRAECGRLRADCTRITTEVRDLRVDCARAAEQREELRALLTEALRRHDSMMRHTMRQLLSAERKRLAADIREAIAKRDAWTSGPEALEHLAQELERE